MRDVLTLYSILCVMCAPVTALGACTAAGTVMNALTGEPVGGAMITLSGADRAGTGSASDVAGRWSFASTACGPAIITATHSGFFEGKYRTSTEVHESTVQLVEGAPVTDLRISLMPQAAVTGRVQDSNGQPVALAELSALHAVVKNGRRTLTVAERSRADDQGNFRMGGLPPGKYIVCANSFSLTFPEGGGEAAIYSEDCSPAPREAGPEAAMPIHGEAHVALTLRTMRGLHVRGKVTGPAGMPPIEVQLARMPGDPLRDRSDDGSDRLLPFLHNAVTRTDGSFDIAAVPPGTYRAEAMLSGRPSGAETLFAESEVEVGTADAEDVQLALRPLGVVSGTVRFEAAREGEVIPPIDLDVELVNPRSGFTYNFTPDATWDSSHRNFVIPRVPSGEYQISPLVKNSKQLWVKAATLNGRDVLAQKFSNSGTAGPVEIVVTDEVSDIDATVTNDKGDPIAGQVLLLDSGGRGIVLTGNQDGHARKHGVPAGEYKAWAFDDVSGVPWAEADWLKQNGSRGTLVKVETGGTAAVTLVRSSEAKE